MISIWTRLREIYGTDTNISKEIGVTQSYYSLVKNNKKSRNERFIDYLFLIAMRHDVMGIDSDKIKDIIEIIGRYKNRYTI